MAFFPVIICFAAGLGIALATIPLIGRFSTIPSARRSSFHQTHRTAIPRLGGLAFAAAFVIVGAYAAAVSPHPPGWLRPALVIFITSLAMFSLGFWDDLRALGATKKLIFQIAIAALAFAGGVQIRQFDVPLLEREIDLGAFSGIVTIAWLVFLTNLVNLIDGIDGLAAGIGLMLMSLLAVVGMRSGLAFTVLCATGLAGAQLGFLRYNFPPARIHMGDGGAYFIGFVIGLLTIVNSQKGTIIAALLAPLLALALPIIDVTTAILRRGLRGLPIFRADRKHIHHRLLALGFSRRKAVLVLYIACLVCLGFAFAVFRLRGVWLPFVFGAFGVTLLLAARSVDFGRDWLSLGRVIGNSIDLRRDSRYALPLVRWLEQEAERVESIPELWEGFQFMCAKFRFASVRLHGAGGLSIGNGSDIPAEYELHVTYEMNLGEIAVLEFSADQRILPEPSFELLAELAAEAWFRSFQRWQKMNVVRLSMTSARGELQALESGDVEEEGPALGTRATTISK